MLSLLKDIENPYLLTWLDLSNGEDGTAETKTPTMTFSTTFNVTLLFAFFCFL